MSTYIEDIIEKPESKYIPSENIEDDIYDFELSYDIRVGCIKKFYEKNGVDATIDIIYHITHLYSVSESTSNKMLLTKIAREAPLDPMLNLTSAKCLCEHDCSDENVETLIICVNKHRNAHVSITYRFALLERVIKNELYHTDVIAEFVYIIKNDMNDANFQNIYMYIRKLGCQELMVAVSESESIGISGRLLSLQYLMVTPETNIRNDEKMNDENLMIDAEREEIQNTVNTSIISNTERLQDMSVLDRILSIAQNATNEYNVRADASDALISSGIEYYKKEGEKLIDLLANVDGTKTKTFYSNAQNVHTKSTIEKSYLMLAFLEKQVKVSDFIEFDYIRNLMRSKVITDDVKSMRLQKSFDRIAGDNIRYGENKYHLLHLLRLVYTFIDKHEYKIELENRLLEELIDMSSTCSSGFFSRLFNTVHGYTTEFIAGMDWSEQICANLTTRLNKILQTEYADSDLQSTILEQMTINDDDLTLKSAYLDFMRKHLGTVSKSLKDEFVTVGGHVSESDFEYFLRDAISRYEGF
jgi:hypothetical protein